jgi:alpha-L-fucosidase
MQVLALAAVFLAAAAGAWAESPPAADNPLTSPRTQWWRDAKFGMFIHWGLYAVPAGVYNGKEVGSIGEWIMFNAHIPVAEYEKFAGRFNPVKFDARQWAKVAKDAGMKYMVITSKHHDGFSMFHTNLTPYNVVAATPWRRDPMKDLAAACKAEGLRFSFYYSIMDWHWPDQDKTIDQYTAYMKGQLKELIQQYGPLGLLWFDGEWIGSWNAERGRDLYGYVRGLQPDIIINNRVGRRGPTDGDYETPEQSIPAGAIKGRLWETCMTLNDTWGYKTSDHNWKSTEDLTRKLIDIVSKGGNFLLNVGPTAEGVIPPETVERLQGVGRWLATNGEAIYGTTAGPWKKYPFDGRATVKGNTLYLHVFKWPEGDLVIKGLAGKVVRVELLDKGLGDVKFAIDNKGNLVTLTVPRPAKTDPMATVVAVRAQGPVTVSDVFASAPAKQAADGTIALGAGEAAIHGDAAQYEGDRDCVGFWNDTTDWVGWKVAVEKPGTFEVSVTYACDPTSAGSEYVFSVAGQELAGKVSATASWSAFTTARLGTVKIEKPGLLDVAVRPRSKPAMYVMNLRSVTLKPLKD